MRTITIDLGVTDEGHSFIEIAVNDGEFVYAEMVDDVAYFISKLEGDDEVVAGSEKMTVPQMHAEAMFLVGLVNHQTITTMKEGF